uniref:Uncharacterized protein AlNc14C14G1621 n=1 Tax=Albugo laibachii Nc14 TaxID=890382 RepID=F0W3V4_9STRA|nr:hypothetical protein ALNC14_018470 [Albugo laibachii Nc14]|eukprot:CCA15704.1 hypothetical protein ALNC14_018470 [Albugo laibachii Nc14]
MEIELSALKYNNVWTRVDQVSMKKIIGTKWVSAMKRNEHGDIERYKARIVALGYRQTDGIDYMETYLSVANMNLIRVFLAYCYHNGSHIHQFDVDTVLLNGKLKEEVYVYPPKGFKTGKNQVLRWYRSLFGLKQAAST